MKRQTKELSIMVEDERRTRWCRGLHHRLARLSHFILYVFLLMLVVLIAYWLRIWPRYAPVSRNLSFTETSARLHKVHTPPRAKHESFHRLRSHKVRQGNHHRGRFNKKPVGRARPSEDDEKQIRGYGVHHRNPGNKVRERKEERFIGRYDEEKDDESDQLRPLGTDDEIKGEDEGILEEARPRKKLPESDDMSEKGRDLDDVHRQAEVRRSEGRLRARKDQKKESRGRGKTRKRPVISKNRTFPKHARTRLYRFEERKTEDSNDANGELNVATIDAARNNKNIPGKKIYHENSNKEHLKPKKNVKIMEIREEMSDQRQRGISQVSSTGKLGEYTSNIKKITGRRNGGKDGTVKEVPGLKTALGSNSYKSILRTSVHQKTTGSQKVADDIKRRIHNTIRLENRKANQGGSGTPKRTIENRINVPQAIPRGGRAQGKPYQNMRSTEFIANRREINKHLVKNIIVSKPNVSRNSQTGILYGVRKDRGHKPGPIITIPTRKMRLPSGSVNARVKTFVTNGSSTKLVKNPPNAVYNTIKDNNKPIAPRPEQQHVVISEVAIPNETAISVLKPRINLNLHAPISGR